MKKLIVAIITCLALAGCGTTGSGRAGIEKEVFPVVEKYLENAAVGNWKEVYETLSGEALAEARANSGRVKEKEKIISKNLKFTPVCKDLVEVSADFTKSTSSGFDRLAYIFRLKKSGGRWMIYKTTFGDYHHGELKPGQLPPQAAETIKAYLELPLTEKRAVDNKYLAGKLLQDSNKAGLLPVDSKSVFEQEKIKTRVINIDPLGISEGYAMVLISYELIKDNKVHLMEALVEVVNVNNNWRLGKLEITKI